MKRAIAIKKAGIFSEISRDIAQVFFATMFVEQIVRIGTSWIAVFIGFFLSIGFWYVSLAVVKN